MRLNGLTSSLCFGAAVAIAFVFAHHLAAPIVGSANVSVVYLAVCTIAYAGLLGSTPRRAIRNAVIAFMGTAFVVTLSSGIVELAIGLTMVLAFVRSGLEGSAWLSRHGSRRRAGSVMRRGSGPSLSCRASISWCPDDVAEPRRRAWGIPSSARGSAFSGFSKRCD